MLIGEDIQGTPASEFSHFYTAAELTKTSHGPNPITHAARYGRIISADDIRKNLKALCGDVLDPVCRLFGKIPLSSCYRDPLVNAAIGGSSNSAHTVGLAADTQPPRCAEVVAFLVKRARDAYIDRLIFEQRGPGRSWLHVQRLQLDSPVRDAFCFISTRADKFERLPAENLIGFILSLSKKVDVPPKGVA